jgi:hypothetical protein
MPSHNSRTLISLLPMLLAVGACASAQEGPPGDVVLDGGGGIDAPLQADGSASGDAAADAGGDARPLVAEETLTAKVDTFIKISPADSAALPADSKCAVPKGGKVSLARIAVAGLHTSGVLVSVHACGQHFTGFTNVPPQPAPVVIVDDPSNYAASCQYRTASRTRSDVTRIILHNTEGRWVNFKSTWQACNRIGAAHFVILRTGVVMRTIAEKNVAYHATVANADSIGVEIESGPGFEGMTPVQEASVIALTTKLQKDFGAAPAGIPTSRVTMHRLAAPGSTDCAKFIWPLDSDFITWRDSHL